MQPITDVQSLMKQYGVQKYAVQPLTYRYYKTLDLSTSLWTEKTDGERETLAFSHDDKHYIIETEKYTLRGRRVVNYLFDIDVFESKNVSSISFAERYQFMQQFIRLYSANSTGSTPVKSKATKQYHFEMKSFYSIIPEGKYIDTFPLSSYVSSFRDLYNFVYDNHKSPMTNDVIDGVIIQTDTRVYKFKRDVLNTNDFLIRCCAPNKYLLYAWNGVSKTKNNDIRINYRFHKHAPKENEFYIPNHTLFVSPFNSQSYILDVSHQITPAERKLYFTEEARTINDMIKKMSGDNYAFSNKIVELSWTGTRWVPLRIREDREYANYYGICINNAAISFSPINPFDEEYFEMNVNGTPISDSAERVFDETIVRQFHDISKLIRKGLFECVNTFMEDTNIGKYHEADAEKSEQKQDTSSKFITELSLFDDGKREITFDYNTMGRKNGKQETPNNTNTNTRRYQKKITTIDLAGGRGGDLHTLLNLGTTNLIAIDNDKSALSWYASRAFETDERFYFNVLHCDVNSDLLTDECLEQLRNLPEYNTHHGADILYCNFAIHYLIPHMNNVKLFIDECMKKDGSIFVYTYYDSDACKILPDDNKFKPTYFNKDGLEYANMPVPTFDSSGFRPEPAVNKSVLRPLVDEKQFEIYEYDDIIGDADVSKFDNDLVEYIRCLRLRICYRGVATWSDTETEQ